MKRFALCITVILLATGLYAVDPPIGRVMVNSYVPHDGENGSANSFVDTDNHTYSFRNLSLSDTNMVVAGVTYLSTTVTVTSFTIGGETATKVTSTAFNDEVTLELYTVYAMPPNQRITVEFITDEPVKSDILCGVYESVSNSVSNFSVYANTTNYAGVTLTANSDNSMIVAFGASYDTTTSANWLTKGDNASFRQRAYVTDEVDAMAQDVSTTVSGSDYHMYFTTADTCSSVAIVAAELEPVSPTANLTYPIYDFYTFNSDEYVIAATNCENNTIDLSGHGNDFTTVGNPFTNVRSYDGEYSVISGDSSNYLMTGPNLTQEIYDCVSNPYCTLVITTWNWNKKYETNTDGFTNWRTIRGSWIFTMFPLNPGWQAAMAYNNSWNYQLNGCEVYAEKWVMMQNRFILGGGTWNNYFYVDTNGKLLNGLGISTVPVLNQSDAIMFGYPLDNRFFQEGYIDRITISKVNQRISDWGYPIEWLEQEVTPTITETITETITPTITSTITETITPTITETITETITPTITDTATPTITPWEDCPEVVATVQCGTAVQHYSRNYGCYAAGYFWIGSDNGDLYKIHGEDASIANVYYNIFGYPSVIDMDSDGDNIWVGHSNKKATLYKFNISMGAVSDSWDLNPTEVGDGGIQDVVYHDGYVWAAVAVAGTTEGRVVKFNPATEAIELTITGQTNVNGLDIGTVDGQDYIFAACDGFFSKINVDTGEQTKVYHGSGYYYRVATDDTYVYLCRWNWSSPGNIKKYNMDTMELEAEFPVGDRLNDIEVWNGYVWVVGDDLDVNVVDKNTGQVVCTYEEYGQSCLIFDGLNMWTNLRSGQVAKISGGDTLPTATTTRTITPTITPTITEGAHYYYSNNDYFGPPQLVSVTTTTGTLTISNSWDGAVMPIISLRSGPAGAVDVEALTHTGYTIIRIVDENGDPVDCSYPYGIVSILYLRHRSWFPWW